MSNSHTGTSARFPAPGEATVLVRKASMADIPAILALINGFAARGIMLPRTEFELAENLRDFSVVQTESGVVAPFTSTHPEPPRSDLWRSGPSSRAAAPAKRSSNRLREKRKPLGWKMFSPSRMSRISSGSSVSPPLIVANSP